MKAVNIILDVLAIALLLAMIIPVGYVVIIAAIFIGVEWYEFLGLGIVIAFVVWRLIRFDA